MQWATDPTASLFIFPQIHNGSEPGQILDTLCGATLPSPVYTTSNALWLEFETDASLTYPGFHITYLSSPTGWQCAANKDKHDTATWNQTIVGIANVILTRCAGRCHTIQPHFPTAVDVLDFCHGLRPSEKMLPWRMMMVGNSSQPFIIPNH